MLVRSEVNIQLWLERLSALPTGLPIASMALLGMEAAERVSAVVPAATYLTKGERDILVLVVADPMTTALCPGQVSGLSAQSTPRVSRATRCLHRSRFGWCGGFLRGCFLFSHGGMSCRSCSKPGTGQMKARSDCQATGNRTSILLHSVMSNHDRRPIQSRR